MLIVTAILLIIFIILIFLFFRKPPKKQPRIQPEGQLEPKMQSEPKIQLVTEPRQIFRKASYFFDSAEQRRLYQLLSMILSGTPYSVFPQARLADVVRTNPDNPHDREMYVKTLSYQLDFVICQGSTYQVELAIELDSPYHHNVQQQERDLFKSRVLDDAQIPLLRLRVEERLTREILTNKLRQYLLI